MLIFLAICAIVMGCLWFLRAQKMGHFIMSIGLVFYGISHLVL